MEEVTLITCKESGGDNSTHHLLPRAKGMTCRYCGLTEKEIREGAEK